MGAGFDAAGTAPAGLGTPTVNTALVAPGYQTSTTGCVSSVLVVASDKDTVFDDYGNEKGMSDSAQRVQLLLGTTLGSRANFQTSGLKRPTHITARTPREVYTYARNALKPAIDDGSITFDGVDVETEGTKVLAVIKWTDNRTQESRDTRLPLRQ